MRFVMLKSLLKHERHGVVSEYSDAASFGPMKCRRIGPSHEAPKTPILARNAIPAFASSFCSTDVRRLGQRRQLDVIEYLQEENRVLKARLGGKHLRLTDAERCRLARKAHALARKLLSELDTLVTPDTLLRWYRHLIARKSTYSRRPGPGRPRVMATIVDLVMRMALAIRLGDTRGSKARWPIWDTRLDAVRSPTFSKRTGSTRHRRATRTPDGQRF